MNCDFVYDKIIWTFLKDLVLESDGSLNFYCHLRKVLKGQK